MSLNQKKMLTGELFDARCSILTAQRKRAKSLCHNYNSTAPDEKGKRAELLSRLFQASRKPHIEPQFFCDYGYNIQLGEHFYANHHCIMLDAAPIIIGDNVMLGPSVNLATTSHPVDPDKRRRQLSQAKPIRIGDNVWIGMGAQILGGVTIGDNAVIAAGAVVCTDIPANCLAGGIPAKVIKQTI